MSAPNQGVAPAANLQQDLADFAAQTPAERRDRAGRLSAEAPADWLERLEPLRLDPDARVRARWVDWFTRPDLAQEGSEHRLRLAMEGVELEQDPAVAKPWLAALARSSSPAVQAWMVRRWRRAEPWRAVELARALRPNPSNHSLLRGVLQDWANAGQEQRGTDALPAGVVAELLPHLGFVLVDAPHQDVTATDYLPIVVGSRHVDGEVRAGAALGLRNAIDRLIERDTPEEVSAHLEALGASGMDPRIVAYEAVRLAFFPMADGEHALKTARALRALAASPKDQGKQAAEQQRRWDFRSRYLAGLALLSLQRAPEARAEFEAALLISDEGLRWWGWLPTAPAEEIAPVHARNDLAELLQERILLLIGQNLALRADGAKPDSPECLQNFVRAHRLSLEVQVLHAGLTGQALSGWDGIFDNGLSPYRLLLHGRAFQKGQDGAGLDGTGQVALEHWLGRGLATVAPREMPGFEPLVGAKDHEYDPVQDLQRRARLEQIYLARLDFLDEQIEALQERIAAAQDSPSWHVPEAELEQLGLLDMQRRRWMQRIEQEEVSRGTGGWLEVRVAGGHALRLARSLRGVGELQAGRDLLRRFQKDLENGGMGSSWYYLGQERLARADLELGANLGDDQQNVESEQASLKGVDRLQGIVDRLQEVGASVESQAPYKEMLANALVSVAVNANVGLKQPERALEFYERAYELKQDEFMRVLLACYRARSGKEREARLLLASVTPTPPLFYNLACTHALLGDTERALHWLRLEFENVKRVPAAWERQKKWARQDPDLESLQGLPAFEGLLD